MSEENETSEKNTVTEQLERLSPKVKRFSWTPFALILLCFFLPFVQVSCQGQKLTSMTGLQMTFGTQISQPAMFGPPKTQVIEGSSLLVLVLVITLACLIASLIRLKYKYLMVSVASAFSLFLLLILKWQIDDEVLKQGGGLLSVEMSIGYILTTFLFLVGAVAHGFFHYEWNKEKQNFPVNISDSQGESINQRESGETGTEFDIKNWIVLNKLPIILIVAAFTFIYGSYQLFFKHTAESDGKKSAVAYCSCTEEYNDDIIEINNDFLKSFDSFGIKNRQEARTKLQELQNSKDQSYADCNNKAQVNYDELKKRYVTDAGELKNFELAFQGQQKVCSLSNQSELSATYQKVENKISTIKNPEPTIEQIKSDLIGQKIQGWNFEYLSEFKSAGIINTTKNENRIEYQVRMQLEGTNSDKHDSEIVVVYLQNDAGWIFDSVKMRYITYANIAPVDQWFQISPLANCSYSIQDQGHNYFIKDNLDGIEYTAGPNQPPVRLSGRQIFIKSAESEPVNLVFKYTPVS